MMLKERLQTDLNGARKQGDVLKRSALGMAVTAVKNRELTKRSQLSKTLSDPAELQSQSELTDDEVLAVLGGEVKKRKEAMEQFAAAGRAELAEKEKQELVILSAYLPEQLDEEKIRAAVRAAIKEIGANGITAMGQVIGRVMGQLKGQADGSTVSRIVQAELGG